MIRDFFNRLLDFIYPRRCPYCQTAISRDVTCCSHCDGLVERDFQKTLVFEDLESDTKSYCFTPLKYKGVVKHAVWRYKFRGCRLYSQHFANEIINCLTNLSCCDNIDFVTFVPITRIQKDERSYNQSEVLATEVSNKLNVECVSALVKVKDNLSQHSLDSVQRVHNVKDIYRVSNDNIVQGKKILLCDDVFTTGSTLKECCKKLYESGAKYVECVAIARTSLN